MVNGNKQLTGWSCHIEKTMEDSNVHNFKAKLRITRKIILEQISLEGTERISKRLLCLSFIVRTEILDVISSVLSQQNVYVNWILLRNIQLQYKQASNNIQQKFKLFYLPHCRALYSFPPEQNLEYPMHSSQCL